MSTKYEVEKFNGKNEVGFWRIKMKVMLTQQGFVGALKGEKRLPLNLTEEGKEESMGKAHGVLILNLGDKSLREVLELDDCVN